jgi:hypothetical protein
MLQDRMKVNFIEVTKDSHGVEPCTKDDLVEFYYDGIKIIEFLKKHRASYFGKKNYELLGIEVELNFELPGNLKFNGFIDVIIRDTRNNRIKIYDIKTSTNGWNKWVKKNKNKTDQLLLYKQFLSLQLEISVDKIDIEYFILKRKLYENVDFPQRKVQLFTPASGKPSLNRVLYKLREFVDGCFDKQGNYLLKEYSTNESKKTCRFCEFNQTEYCDKGIK